MKYNKEKNFISAVVYVHNSAKQIKTFIEQINNTLNKNFEKYEIIFVNDKSTDDSRNEIVNASNQIKNTVISIVDLSYFQGSELAMQAGVDLAIGDFIYEFDDVKIDYDTNLLMKIYKEALNGFDIVSAKPNKRRRITSWLFYKVFNKYANNMSDIDTETFRIISRRAINRVNSINLTVPYRKAVYANCGLKTNSIKYDIVKNKDSRYKNKANEKYRKELAINSIVLFTDVFSKFTLMMSIFMMIITIATAIYTLCIFIASKPVEGWTTTMLLLSFCFFAIFTIFTIIIKYLSILIDLIFTKQKYVVESIEKITK